VRLSLASSSAVSSGAGKSAGSQVGSLILGRLTRGVVGVRRHPDHLPPGPGSSLAGLNRSASRIVIWNLLSTDSERRDAVRSAVSCLAGGGNPQPGAGTKGSWRLPRAGPPVHRHAPGPSVHHHASSGPPATPSPAGPGVQAQAIRENTTRSSSRPCSLMKRNTIVVRCPGAAGVTSSAMKP
jgi:hypothetical protein